MLVILHARHLACKGGGGEDGAKRHLPLTREVEEVRTLACEEGGRGCRELCQNVIKMHLRLALACEGSGRHGNATKTP